MKGILTVMLASVTVSSVTSKGLNQGRGQEMQAERGEMLWLSSHTIGTMAALWLLTGGPLKFTNILYKVA